MLWSVLVNHSIADCTIFSLQASKYQAVVSLGPLKILYVNDPTRSATPKLSSLPAFSFSLCQLVSTVLPNFPCPWAMILPLKGSTTVSFLHSKHLKRANISGMPQLLLRLSWDRTAAKNYLP